MSVKSTRAAPYGNTYWCLAGNGWDWGLLGWLLIVIMDIYGSFPNIFPKIPCVKRTSKNLASGTPEEIWRFSSLISHRNTGWIFPPSLMKPEGHHWFVMGGKPSTHGHISWELLVTTPTVKDQLEHPKNWCFSQKLQSSSDPHQLAFYLTYILTISGILSGILSGTLAGSRTRKHQPATAFWNFFKRGRETGNRYSGNKAPSQPWLQHTSCWHPPGWPRSNVSKAIASVSSPWCLCNLPQQVRSGPAKCWGCVRFCVLANLPKPNPGWTVHNPVSWYLQVWYCNSFIRNHLQATQYSITKMSAVSTLDPSSWMNSRRTLSNLSSM